MHYYQFNIGDYASHTRHLDLLEDLAYRRILDLYYLHERPLNGDATLVAKQIGMRDDASRGKRRRVYREHGPVTIAMNLANAQFAQG